MDLLDAYVPANLSLEDEQFAADDVLTKYLSGSRIVISGLAGRGKSVLLKYYALSMYTTPRGYIPLFLELRSFNTAQSTNVLRFVHETFKSDTGVALEDMTKACRKGYFAFLFDGFDEVEPKNRSVVEAQLLALAADYPKCPLMVSGRPDDRYNSWGSFTNYSVAPMSYRSTRRLIMQADYDLEVKAEFLKRLTPAFFNKHKSFLSTPLLAVMLMLTFQDFAEIPSTLHVFYRNAFDTLVRRHDALKTQFLRKMHSGLSAEQFRRLFASFCLLTYSKAQFQFHHTEIVSQVELSVKQQQMSADPEQVLLDLIESICLLQKEGFLYSFVHRSFQEYFCALFVSTSPSGSVAKYLNSARYRSCDDVLPMLYRMAPDRVEKEWVLPVINDLIEHVDSQEDRAVGLALAMHPTLMFERFTPTDLMIQFSGEGQFHRAVSALQSMYRAQFADEINEEPDDLEGEAKKWQDKITSVIAAHEAEGDQRFAGATATLSMSSHEDKRSILAVHLTGNDRQLLTDIDMMQYYERTLSQLRALRDDVRLRVSQNDQFLESVFGSTT